MRKEGVKVNVKEDVEESKLFTKVNISLFSVLLIVGLVFYVSLGIVKSGQTNTIGTGGVAFSPNEKQDFNFGLEEIIYSLVFAFLMAGFLIWVKSLIGKNAYLGVILGIVGTGMFGYGFSKRYWGTYSLIFLSVTGLIILSYLGFSFWKDKKEYEEDEELE